MSIAYYDANARQFFDRTVDADMRTARQKFLRFLNAGDWILDAGCGSGRDTRAFAEAGYKVTAFDGSPRMVELARAYTGLPVEYLTFDQVAWHQRFDGIWACASLLHVRREELPTVLTRLREALVPQGVLFASFKEGSGERVGPQGRHFTNFTVAELSALLIACGFAIVESFSGEDSRTDHAGENWTTAIARRS